MEHEIGDRHLSGKEEGNGTGEKAEQEQRTAEKFQHGGNAEDAAPAEMCAHAGIGEGKNL